VTDDLSHTQAAYDIRFDWGMTGLASVGAGASVLVVVDVLSFSTAVDIAVARGAAVAPAPGPVTPADHNGDGEALAVPPGAVLARSRSLATPEHPWSLSPASLQDLPSGTLLVLPSPNGGSISHAATQSGATVLAGCLRNRSAVAQAARACGGPIAVVAAGERWPDGSLRPALEDLVGAGAVISALLGSESPSPEAAATASAFAASDPGRDLAACASGRELLTAGYIQDVTLASMIDASDAEPVLGPDGYYRS